MNILFLHGLAGEPNDWDTIKNQMERLGHLCLAPRIPYFTETYSTIEEPSKMVALSVDSNLINSDFIVVGNSLGCSIALRLGGSSRAMLLVAPHVVTSSHWIGRGEASFQRELGKIFFDPSLLDEERKKHYANLWLSFHRDRDSVSKIKKIKKAIANDNIYEGYINHQHKIHLILGEHDKISPQHLFNDIQANYPGVTTHEIRDCGHAIPIEAPGELCFLIKKMILDFEDHPSHSLPFA